MHRILLVDDEVNILRALRRCLLSGRSADAEPFTVEMVTSPREAIARICEIDFSLIVSDYRMPEMNGLEFLLRAAEENPSARRVLMSAYADREAVLTAIHDAGIVAFIAKPWDDARLRATIEEVLQSRP